MECIPLEKRKIERFDSKKYSDIIKIGNWKLEKHHKSPFICWLLSEEGKEKECVERKKQEERSFNWIPSNWQQEILRSPIFFSLPNEENPKWLAGSILNYNTMVHLHRPLYAFSTLLDQHVHHNFLWWALNFSETKALIYKEFKKAAATREPVSPTPRVSTLWIVSIIPSTSMSQPRHYHGKSEIWF